MTQKEAVAKAPERRVRRTPLGTRQVLSLRNKEAGYEYRFVNDTGDRVQRFLDAGWEMVDANDVVIGDKRVNNVSPEGTKAQASVGQGIKSYVMRIREDWYKEDQDAKQAEVTRIEDASRKEALEGYYGKIETSRGT